MRLAIMHNPTAGHDDHPLDDLRRRLELAGHTVVYCDVDDDMEQVRTVDCDGMIVLGGDGTVAKVGLRAVGRGIPLAVVPAGTANNIAEALGVRAPLEVAARWDAAVRRCVDTGFVRGPWGTAPMLESVGVGLVPFALSRAKLAKKDADASFEKGRDALTHDLGRVRDALHECVPRRLVVEVDGRRRDGTFLGVEVMNIGRVGPGLALAPDADPTDGVFDVLLLPAAARERLDAHFAGLVAGNAPEAPDVPRLRGRSIRIAGFEGAVHVDGRLWPLKDPVLADPDGAPTPAVLDVEVRPASLTFLVAG